MCAWVVMLAALILLAPVRGAAGGESAPAARAEPSLASLRQEAEAARRDLGEHEAAIDQITRREGDVLNLLEATAQTLDQQRRKVVELRVELEHLELKIASTGEALEDLTRRIRAGESYLYRRMIALYKAGRIGTADLLWSADSVAEAVKRQAALERIVAHDENLRQTLLRHHAELRELRSRLQGQQEQQQARLGELDRQLAAVRREGSKREKLLAALRADKEALRTAIDGLKDIARALERNIQRLGREPGSPAARRTVAAKPLAASKGLLIFPVKGKIVNPFGPYRQPEANIPGFRSGIDIAADRGEPVKAVHGGSIAFADWFKGYGNVVIIDHGEHYYTVYAHLQDVFKSVDNRVEAGDVIATVGDSGVMGSTGLYFELRFHDRPLNPLDWLQPG